MKKILCDKDGKFLSVHEKNETFVELKDGDYLTYEDGCILIYKEYECKENISEISYHVYLRNNKLHFLKLECHFLTMILSHLSDFLQKKKKNVCTKFFLKTTYTMTRKKNALKSFAGVPKSAIPITILTGTVL